jgi:hypothetical protein
MMKLHQSTCRETLRLAAITHNQRLAVRKTGRSATEPLFIGAATERPSARAKAIKLSSLFAMVVGLMLGAPSSFATLPLGTGFTYQGRLNDGGAPANGNYDMIFNIYDDPVAGNMIGSFSIFGAVPVTNGLFSVELNAFGEFGTNAFSGQARWLEIGVRTNSNALANFVYLNPRQPLTPAPQAIFALNASNAMNASFAANVADGSVTGSKLAPGALAWTNLAGLPPGFADGVDNDTHYGAGPGLSLNGSNEFNVNFGGSGSANTAARSDHQHFGANWSGNSSGYGLTVVNNSTTGTGIYGQQGTGSGQFYPFGYTAAIWGEASQGDGVYGASGSSTGTGVYGYATASSGANSGVFGRSSSTNGVGVIAMGSGTSGTALKISNGAIRVTGAGVGTSTPVFVHKCTTNNITFFLSTSIIDNPYCNNDPNAILIVTPGPTPQSVIHPSPAVAVVYDPGFWFPNRWLLATTDGSHFVTGDSYNIMIVKP